MVQWLRLHTFYIGVTGLIPGGVLKSHMLCDMAKIIYIYIYKWNTVYAVVYIEYGHCFC